MFIQSNLNSVSGAVHSTASGEGGKISTLIKQTSILSIPKHVHSKATYTLLVEQFTVEQVGKGGKKM